MRLTYEEVLAEREIHDEIQAVRREEIRLRGLPSNEQTDEEIAKILAPVEPRERPRGRIVR